MIAHKPGNVESARHTEILHTYPEAARKAKAAARSLSALSPLAIKSKRNREVLRNYGFNGPVAYAILGIPDTKMLKEHGAKYSVELRWICPIKPVWLNPLQYVPVKATDLFECADDYKLCLKASAFNAIRNLDPMVGRYSARIGAQVTHRVYVVEVREWCSKTSYGETFSTYLYTMKTAGGHTLVWHTPSDVLKKGGVFVLSGVVKEHYDHYNVRCTRLVRCKVLKEGMWNDHP